jgi:hypothetical protein
LVEHFSRSTPLFPLGDEPDFIVSANCLSQFRPVPAATLRLFDQYETLPARCAAAAAIAHFRLFVGSNAVEILLTGVARLEVSAEGTETKQENTLEHLDLRSPD